MGTIRCVSKSEVFKKIALVTFFTSILSACGGSDEPVQPAPPTPNQAPTADAGSDLTIDENTSGTLNGAGTDSDGTISTYLWSQTAGPSISLSSTSIDSPTFVAPEVDADTTVSFDLTVTDNGGLTATDSIEITIINLVPANIPPTANAGVDFTIDENTSGTLNGAGTDSDGTISTYLWSQTAGPSISLSSTSIDSPTFVAPEVDADTTASFDLTVTDNGGLTASDSIEITILHLEPANIPPIANAGVDLQGIIGQSVDLDGSNSSDDDGTISSYLWSQVDNGSPLLSLTSLQAMSTSIVIPDLSGNIEFEFLLTVTDNDGDTATDTVIVLGRPIPLFIVGNVIGNTASVNSLAQFSVKMGSQPSADVSINVASSDELEGISEQSALTFTSTNWSTPQLVSVYGQNPNVVNGEQDYLIEISAATSTDTLYHGMDPEDVALKGIELVITVQTNALAILPSVPFVYQVDPKYTGNNPLTYSLSNAPAGMTIDFNDGVIGWVPPATLASGDLSVDITVNDGSKFSNATIAFNVGQTDALSTSYDDTTSQLTITEADSTLNGVRLQQVELGDAMATLTLRKVDKVDIADLPFGVVALTDGVIVNDIIDAEVDIRFSLSDLPSGVKLDDVRYYIFGKVSESVEPVWSVGGFNRQFSGTEQSPFVSFQFSQLPALGFFGYKEQPVTSTSLTANATSNVASNRLVETVSEAGISCAQKTFLTVNIDEFECTSTLDTDVIITVENWGSNTLRWTNVSKELMVSWLVDARPEFTRQNLSFDDEFTVRIETMNYLGYVNPAENSKILHITDRNTYSSTMIQGTSVHEYYHHAQGHPDSELPNKSLVINGSNGRTAWLYEGTARWVEDVIFDNINSYKEKERSGQRILEIGLTTGLGKDRHRPYQRFSFFKLLDEKCPTMTETMQEVFNHTATSDPLALKNLNGLLSGMGCNFGDHFEASNNATLAAALSFYSVATQLKNSMTALDANETNVGFSFDKPNYRFSPSISTSLADVIAQPNGTTHTLQNVAQVKSAGAISFEVPALTGAMPAGKVAEILVQSTSQVYVSIASNDSGFVSTNTIDGVPHTWFSTSVQSSFVYGEEGSNLPKLFVTLVNADEDANATVSVTFRVRDELNVDTIINSHQSGEAVDDRVVSISGSIPAEGREFTNDVHITANGITTVVPMSTNGDFSGDVVMSLGANNVKAQGFNGNTPTTREEIIILNGVAAGSTGVNALIASRVVFVLRWDTATDIDIYSKDPLDETIWYRNKTASLGNLDRDDISGFGPEVISYRAEGNAAYNNGQFDIDVHYYSGSPSTNYTIDVILNETEGANRRNYQFSSLTPLTDSSSSEAGVDDTGSSRFNDILFISCNAASVCGLSSFDNSKLSLSTGFGTSSIPNATVVEVIETRATESACENAKAVVVEKYGFSPQTCEDKILK
ncbi:PKD domain-containing protein [Colwellia hornerae]|nr:putative Ig domain-containing protein [Colwellia hornerae]